MTITQNPMPVPMVGVKRLGNPALEAGGPYPVLYGGRGIQARLGSAQGGPYPVLYGGRGVQMRLGRGAFAPSVLYGVYAHQAYGFGRHRYARRGRGVGGYPSRMSSYARLSGVAECTGDPNACLTAWASGTRGLSGYPRLGAVSVPARVSYMATRLGQSLWDDVTSLFTPVPGGGSVTVDGTTQYVNSSGQDQSTPDPTAGSSNPLDIASNDATGLATAAVSGIATSIPWWGWALLAAGGGLLAYKVLK
jgi:hypothetical protein